MSSQAGRSAYMSATSCLTASMYQALSLMRWVRMMGEVARELRAELVERAVADRVEQEQRQLQVVVEDRVVAGRDGLRESRELVEFHGGLAAE